MFHSRDSPRLLVCDIGLYMEQNDIGFVTVAICGGYISKYPRLICIYTSYNKYKRQGYSWESSSQFFSSHQFNPNLECKWHPDFWMLSVVDKGEVDPHGPNYFGDQDFDSSWITRPMRSHLSEAYVRNLLETFYLKCECNHSRGTRWIVLNLGTHISSDKSWFIFQGHWSKSRSQHQRKWWFS